MARTLTSTVAAPPTSGERDLAVRKAAMQDIQSLLRLVNAFASQGIMLPRTEFEIAENLRDFSVIHSAGEVVGCAALHFYTPTMGEIRSLAVAVAFQHSGAGRKLMTALEEEAQAFGLQAVFAFTYIPEFFAKLGYTGIERGELPLKAWKDCLRCPKFQCCDEIAVIKRMAAGGAGVADTHICGSTHSPDSETELPVILPSVRKSH
jgi:amino-acid N-acetyltransferase